MVQLNEKVSVIMPVYNTLEAYLSVSVDCILKQTHDNIELIIIDDGSEEACATFCDELASKDARIKVIHQNNSGVSNARNKGTEIAAGNYVMYVDSDDILERSAIQEGLHCLSKTGASFAFAAIQHIYDYKQFDNDSKKEKTPEFFLYQGADIDKLRSSFLALCDNDFLNIGGSGFVNRGPCARIIRKDIATKVKFNEKLKIGEDVEWNMRLLNESVSVCFVKTVWYGYLIYQTSSLRKYYGNRARLLEDYHRTLYESNKEFCDSHQTEYVHNVVVSFYSMVRYEYLSKQNPQSEREKVIEIKRLLKKFPWNLMLEKHISKNIPIQYRAFICFCRVGCGLSLLRFWDIIKKNDGSFNQYSSLFTD